MQKLGASLECLVDDEEVARIAARERITRSMANIRVCARRNKEGIYLQLCRLHAVWASPRTMESSPQATRKRWLTGASRKAFLKGEGVKSCFSTAN